MRQIRFLVLAAISLAPTLLTVTAAQADSTLTRAELFTLTGDDNKDHDTCVWATIMTADGQTELAHIENGDCGGDDSTEYNDHSPHTIKLVMDAAGASKDACKGFVVRLWQKTHGGAGHDTWKIDQARVTLFFTDGLNLVAERDGFALVSNGQGDTPTVTFAQGH
jgi:hypothetical protein